MLYHDNLCGIEVTLKITGYKPLSNPQDYNWCKCDFSFSQGDFLNYHCENQYILESGEIEQLENALGQLLKAIPHNYCRAFTQSDFSADCSNSTQTG